jgi:hypothetical protein
MVDRTQDREVNSAQRNTCATAMVSTGRGRDNLAEDSESETFEELVLLDYNMPL